MRGVISMIIKKEIELNSEDITRKLNYLIDTESYEAFRELEQIYEGLKGTLEQLVTVRDKVEDKENSELNQVIQKQLNHIFDSVGITYDMYYKKAVGRDFIPNIEREVIKDINKQMRALRFSEKTIIERQSYLNKLSYDSLYHIKEKLPSRNSVMEHAKFNIANQRN